ncbi:MAG: hypothetical protein ACRDNL_28200 [Spirillospora sp.]
MKCVFGVAAGLVLGGLGAMVIAGRTADGTVAEVDVGALWLFTAIYGAWAAVITLVAALMYRALRADRLTDSAPALQDPAEAL